MSLAINSSKNAYSHQGEHLFLSQNERVFGA